MSDLTLAALVALVLPALIRAVVLINLVLSGWFAGRDDDTH